MKLSQAPITSVIGCWSRPGITLVNTEEKCHSDHGVRGPQKTYFKTYITHWHGQTGFCVGRGKGGALVEKGKGLWQRNIVMFKILTNFFGGREYEDKRMVKLVFFVFFSKVPFLNIYQTKSMHSLFGAWSFLLVHIQFTPNEGPKDFVNWSFKNLDHEKRPFSMVPWCKLALSSWIFKQPIPMASHKNLVLLDIVMELGWVLEKYAGPQ